MVVNTSLANKAERVNQSCGPYILAIATLDDRSSLMPVFSFAAGTRTTLPPCRLALGWVTSGGSVASPNFRDKTIFNLSRNTKKAARSPVPCGDSPPVRAVVALMIDVRFGGVDRIEGDRSRHVASPFAGLRACGHLGSISAESGNRLK